MPLGRDTAGAGTGPKEALECDGDREGDGETDLGDLAGPGCDDLGFDDTGEIDLGALDEPGCDDLGFDNTGGPTPVMIFPCVLPPAPAGPRVVAGLMIERGEIS